jgi:hypothetical protein
MPRRNLLAATTLIISLCGCASYVTPGGPARLDQINRADIAEAASRRPTVTFPARVGVVRIQANEYRSYSNEGYGRGQFTAVTTQELLTDEQMEAVSKWPSLSAVIPITRLTIPSRLDSIDDLRVAGAKIQADILLVYTIDTSFRIQGKGYGPLSAISLGIIPDRDAYITATASAILVDVRSGFVYGGAEATAKKSGLTNVWESSGTVDRKRVQAEEEAFGQLVEQISRTWTGVIKQYSAAGGS